MTKRRFILLALLVGVLAFIAAGCGGDDDNEAAGTGGSTETGGASNVSGNISVLAVWTGAEGKAFQAVLDGFTEKNPDVKVSYKSAKEPATVLSTAVEGGNPPDIAALPQPGFMTDFAQRGALKPIDFAEDKIKEGYSESWLDLGTVDGKLYGLFFKGANKSTVWYNVPVFEDAGVEPPEDWDAFLKAGDKPHDEVLADAIERGRAYLAAGAPVVFVPGKVSEDDINAFVDAWGPQKLTLMGGVGSVPLARMEELGVARVSYGPWAQSVALMALQDLTTDVISGGGLPKDFRSLN